MATPFSALLTARARLSAIERAIPLNAFLLLDVTRTVQ
jgi:hypothetical protein